MHVHRTRAGRRIVSTSAAVLALGGLVLTGCTQQRPQADPSASSSPSSPTLSTPTPSSTAAEAYAKDDGLDEWFNDRDHDFVPDKVQQEMGENGAVDPCASKVCKSQSAKQAHGIARIIRGTSTMIILDSSGSMAARTKDGQTRMAAAKKAVRGYVQNAPGSAERLGLMVYGQVGSNSKADKAKSCKGIKTLESIGDLNRHNVGRNLKRFEPTGWTPLAGSLRAAAKEFDGQKSRVNRIVVVTDGIEECGGNPKAQSRKLNRSGFNVQIDVVGLGVEDHSSRAKLANVADVSGGSFTAVDTTAELESYFDQLLAQWVVTAKLGRCVANHFASYSSCQAVRWQKAQQKMQAEASKLRSQGNAMAADRIEQRVTAGGTYFLTTLATRGVTAAEDLSPDSPDIKRIQRHLRDSGAHGRAALRPTRGYDCPN
ncbi:MAG: VWA domain-containing protein [Streptosporangiales bacterium]